MEYLKLFASLTKDYEERFLTDSTEMLENDWWEALRFFFGRVFYQGRRDDISKEVERTVIEALMKHFGDKAKRDLEFERLKKENWNGVNKELKEKIGKRKIGKPLDIDLTVYTLNFISSPAIPDRNIVNYTVRKIKLGEISMHSKELQDKIRGVGPKISSLYLRDVVSLFDLENCLRNGDYEAVMPVDTWIRKIAKNLEIVRNSKAKDNEIVRAIIDMCKENNISPIQINQGIWYIGTQRFEPCFNRVLKAMEETKKGRTQEASNQLVECAEILEVLSSLEKDQDERSYQENYKRRLLSLV